MIERLHERGDQILKLLESMFDQSSLRDITSPDDPFVYVGPRFAWNDLSEAGQHVQSRLLNGLAEYIPLVEFMVHIAPTSVVTEVENANESCGSSLIAAI